jgi:aromatic-amino-acid transaminase
MKPFPGDPILSLNEDFQQDPRTNKVNLSIGIYFDDEGRLPVMKAVAEAEAALLSGMDRARTCRCPAWPSSRPARGAGVRRGLRRSREAASPRADAGRLGRAARRRRFPEALLPEGGDVDQRSELGNHRVVFERAGFKVNTYPYYDPATGGLKFDAMLPRSKRSRKATSCCCACCHTRPAST